MKLLLWGFGTVLMLLGFMSLILAVTQRPISKICIPNRVANTMLPCRKLAPTKTTKTYQHLSTNTHHQDLIPDSDPGRNLAADYSSSSSDYCDSKVLVPLIVVLMRVT